MLVRLGLEIAIEMVMQMRIKKKMGIVMTLGVMVILFERWGFW